MTGRSQRKQQEGKPANITNFTSVRLKIHSTWTVPCVPTLRWCFQLPAKTRVTKILQHIRTFFALFSMLCSLIWEPICPSGNHHLLFLLDWLLRLLFQPTFTYISVTDCHPFLPQCLKTSLTLIQASEMIFSYLTADFITSKRRITQSWPLFSWFPEELQVAEGKKNHSSAYHRGTCKIWVPAY